MQFSAKQRAQNIKRLQNETFDLVIVGGGITGAGAARDAASRGLKVAVIEAKDFAIGTSSRSSKLIHGGVRYLENLEFHLVFEALSERALLFKLAPHLVHPLRFLIPIYKNSRVGYWKMLLGMWLYDLLALFETPQMHESLNAAQTRERVPSLDGRSLVGAMEYSDAYTDDDRLVIETLRDAHRQGAVIVNFTEVTGAVLEEDSINALKVEDKVTGSLFQVKSQQYMSGVGPWTDIFGESIDNNWKKQLRPTKGVHLVFSKARIPVKKAVVMAVEKRIIFVIPREEMVIVGTTDTDFKGDPRDVRTDIEDVTYLLNALNHYFPTLNIQDQDILSSYCGVRPLVNDGSSTEGKTSREHSIWSHGKNMTFVAGGKYTTYRLISEQAVDHVIKKMPFETAMSFNPSNTKLPLNPLVDPSSFQRSLESVEALAAQYEQPVSLVKKCVQRHGAEAEVLLKYMNEKYGAYSVNQSYWMAEAEFAIKHTMCMNLTDFYWRRSPLFLATRDHGIKYIDVISQVFANYFAWTDEQTQRQKNKLMEQMQKELEWKGQSEEYQINELI